MIKIQVVMPPLGVFGMATQMNAILALISHLMLFGSLAAMHQINAPMDAIPVIINHARPTIRQTAHA
jgi:hypothetical protein